MCGYPVRRERLGDMDVFEWHGRLYEFTLVSHATRDGVSLELADLSEREGQAPTFEVFWHDNGSGFDLRSFGASNIPLR